MNTRTHTFDWFFINSMNDKLATSLCTVGPQFLTIDSNIYQKNSEMHVIAQNMPQNKTLR